MLIHPVPVVAETGNDLEKSLGVPTVTPKPVVVPSNATSTPIAFVNEHWDWVEGITSAGATVQVSVVRGGSVYITTQTTADSTG